MEKPAKKIDSNTTRKLTKLLGLKPDDIYHVFCLALCMGAADGKITDKEGEVLTRLGFGMGLSAEDISALSKNARDAVEETSTADVIAFSVASLKGQLDHDQLSGVKQILQFVAASDHVIADSESQLLQLVKEVWAV